MQTIFENIIMNENEKDISPKEFQDRINKCNLSRFDNPQLKFLRLKMDYDWVMCLVLVDKGIKNG